LKGGKARAEKLTAAQRSEISRKGGATHRIKQIKVLHKCPNCEKIYYKLLPGNTTDKKIYEFCPKCEFLRYTPDTVAMEYRLRA
jgi:Zn finger protein HypA/HybF involved in hydrogenase expression